MKNNLIIAELGSVHDGSFGNAINLIKLAASCGADCVKFQTHISDAESLPSAPNPIYFSEESRMDYFDRTAFSLDQWKSLKKTSEKLGLIFLSSPFSLEAVDILEKLGVQIYKIPSGEVSNLPLLEKIAKTKKPVLLSSGMSNWDELDLSVSILKKCDLTIMQCSSIYPCPPEHVGLNVLSEIQEKYNCKIGFSDHTIGFSASISAAAIGAKVIEKHLTFSKLMYGSDAKHSMEPDDFKIFCGEIKNTWQMLKNPVDKDNIENYSEMKITFQKSVVSACNIPKNSIIKLEHLAFKKPGDGIPASNYKGLIGRKTKIGIKKNKQINEKDLK